MSRTNLMCVGLLAALAGIAAASPQAVAQQQQRPNIIFIMGDDIGWFNIREKAA